MGAFAPFCEIVCKECLVATYQVFFINRDHNKVFSQAFNTAPNYQVREQVLKQYAMTRLSKEYKANNIFLDDLSKDASSSYIEYSIPSLDFIHYGIKEGYLPDTFIDDIVYTINYMEYVGAYKMIIKEIL